MCGSNRLHTPAALFFVLLRLQAREPQIGLNMGNTQEDPQPHKTKQSFHGRPANSQP
jgi:hypothetical protein